MKIKNLDKILQVLFKFREYEIWKDIIWEYARDKNPTNYEIGVNETAVDIGANIGIFTLYAVTKSKKVYSYEPSRNG
ncbi:MAG: hypothetical protein GY936_07235 [Ignavibacteriae bacterium]|nr:hypothetical protein [Ignavibacteriota bacterium]